LRVARPYRQPKRPLFAGAFGISQNRVHASHPPTTRSNRRHVEKIAFTDRHLAIFLR